MSVRADRFLIVPIAGWNKGIHQRPRRIFTVNICIGRVQGVPERVSSPYAQHRAACSLRWQRRQAVEEAGGP